MPARDPDVIVQANDEREVAEALQLAAREGHRVAVRSGGHSWSGHHVREGGMLLDVSRLRRIEVDADKHLARVGPGCVSEELLEHLEPKSLFFPVGHCHGVGLRGFLLQGGFGWNSRVYGPACMSVEAIDYVDAQGIARHASETENQEMLWAARGAGPGFFGVVTRFHLRVYDRPAFVGVRAAVYRIDRMDDVFQWLERVRVEVPASVEFMAVVSRDAPLTFGQAIEVIAVVFADSYADARTATRFMDSRPRGAARVLPLVPFPVSLMLRGSGRHYPEGAHYAVDNMWTNAPMASLLPGLRRIAETMPAHASHMLWLNWSPPADRPAMAFSMEASTYLALYGVWSGDDENAPAADWPRERMMELAPLAKGIQLADENLAERPMRFMGDTNLVRLEMLRRKHDEAGRFHGYVRLPKAHDADESA